MPSRDLTSEDLFSSRMMSMQSSTHSSQMKTVGPAINLRPSCWLLPQNEQYSVFLESLVPTLLIHVSVRGSISSARSPHPARRPAQGSNRANSVPKKTLRVISRANQGGSILRDHSRSTVANHAVTRLSRIR